MEISDDNKQYHKVKDHKVFYLDVLLIQFYTTTTSIKLSILDPEAVKLYTRQTLATCILILKVIIHKSVCFFKVSSIMQPEVFIQKAQLKCHLNFKCWHMPPSKHISGLMTREMLFDSDSSMLRKSRKF